MKIAVATEDGTTISQHFGRAPYYAVLTVEDGQVVGREMREKEAHVHGPQAVHVHEHVGEHAHDGPAAHDRHGRMAAVIADCQALIARGMGTPAQRNLVEAGIRPVLTTVASIDEAASAYIAGALVDHPERLHRH